MPRGVKKGIMTPAKGDTLKKYTNQTIDKIPGQKAGIFGGRQNTDWTKNLTCLRVFCPIDKKSITKKINEIFWVEGGEGGNGG